MTRPSFVLWMPGLFVVGETRTALLVRLMARGTYVRRVCEPPERALFGLFAICDDPLPFAAATHAADTGVSDDRTWLRVDPVHLALGPQQAFLTDPAVLALSRAEADAFGALLAPLFTDYGYALETQKPGRWYVCLEAEDVIRTTPLRSALGCDIAPLLPSGPRRTAWHRLLTEAQMLLHGSEVNQAREDRGQPVVNSLWLWGEGRLTRPSASWSCVLADDLLIDGLARASNCASGPVPGHAAELLEHDMRGRCLIAPRPIEDAETLDTCWLTPLFAALRANRLSSVTLVDGLATLEVGAQQVRRWWRFAGFYGRH
ncbi:MAG: hypothetical protein ACYDDA_00785 [Acidiferrobacteraceae bacterium]